MLTHEDSSLFHRSEWDNNKNGPSTTYTVYRVAMALFMSTGIALHFVSTLDTLGIKWFIYMTNQGTYKIPFRLILLDKFYYRYWFPDPPLSDLCWHCCWPEDVSP